LGYNKPILICLPVLLLQIIRAKILKMAGSVYMNKTRFVLAGTWAKSALSMLQRTAF